MRNPNSRIPDLKKIFSPSGSREKKIYESRFNGQQVVLHQTGVYDVQTEIESYAPFTDLNFMLHRLSLGDRSVLNPKTPFYADVTRYPGNVVDFLNIINRAESDFGSLDPEERQKYHNDYRVWLSAVMAGLPGISDSGNADPAPRKDSDKGDVTE